MTTAAKAIKAFVVGCDDGDVGGLGAAEGVVWR
jgi:hypothetical protein